MLQLQTGMQLLGVPLGHAWVLQRETSRNSSNSLRPQRTKGRMGVILLIFLRQLGTQVPLVFLRRGRTPIGQDSATATLRER